eukprot:1147824-Pelagomonas_calceolata.AAC.1
MYEVAGQDAHPGMKHVFGHGALSACIWQEELPHRLPEDCRLDPACAKVARTALAEVLLLPFLPPAVSLHCGFRELHGAHVGCMMNASLMGAKQDEAVSSLTTPFLLPYPACAGAV